MKISSYLFLVLFLLSFHANAQDCDKTVLRSKPGKWKSGRQGLIQNVTAADLAREKSVMTAIHKMVSSRYKPTGCVVDYSNAYGKHLPAARNWIADPYTYTMFILRYLCDPSSADKSKYYTDYSTPTNVSITANVIYSLNNLYAASIAEDETRDFLKLKKRPEKRDDFWFMGEEVVGDGHLENKIKEYRWLITYNDTLPFSYLSRRDYLLMQKKRLQKKIGEMPSEEIYLEEYIKNIDEYLKRPESELIKPAVCMWNDEERFEQFVEEGTPGSFIAVVPNLAYYRRKMPKSSPQFFTVVYKIAHGDPVFEDNIAAIQQAVDFSLLRSMLGK